MRGMTGLVVSRMMRGTTATATCGAMCGIAGRETRSMTPAAIRLTPDQSTVYSLRSTIPETPYDIAFPTKDEGLPETKLRTMPQPIPQTVWGVVPRVGESS